MRKPRDKRKPILPLTPRALEIARLIAEGKNQYGVRKALGISMLNVSNYFSRLHHLHAFPVDKKLSAQKFLENYNPPQKAKKDLPGLSPRALTILRRYALGEPITNIAATTLAIKPRFQRGKPVKVSTIKHTVSLFGTAMGLYGRVGALHREGIRKWLDKNGYMPSTNPDPMFQ